MYDLNASIILSSQTFGKYNNFCVTCKLSLEKPFLHFWIKAAGVV